MSYLSEKDNEYIQHSRLGPLQVMWDLCGEKLVMETFGFTQLTNLVCLTLKKGYDAWDSDAEIHDPQIKTMVDIIALALLYIRCNGSPSSADAAQQLIRKAGHFFWLMPYSHYGPEDVKDTPVMRDTLLTEERSCCTNGVCTCDDA